jgi:starvation-inducible outer membrane lipoprotein
MFRIWMLLVAAGLLLAGCASTDDNLQRETARSIGQNLSPDAISVTNIDRGMTNVRWDAATPNGAYQCSADDMVRRVVCVKH